MIALIIKGDTSAAFEAAGVHNVELTSIVKHERFDECICTTHDNTPWTTLAQWFHEGTDGEKAPNPPGTLLWFGPARGYNRRTRT